MKDVKNIAIIGFGLLGASLGMALRGKGYRRLGWTRRNEVRLWAVENNVVDQTADNVSDLLANADLTILCLPVPQIMQFMRDHSCKFKTDSIVTDIGSVKGVIVDCGESVLHPLDVSFIGSHPMAGTEKSGPKAAFEALYANAEVFVTKTANSNQRAIRAVFDFWEAIGTRCVIIDPAKHDILVAHTSHISHILALALTEAVLDCKPEDKNLRYSGCATGFRDTSRITSSSPLMWREIIENNQSAVLETVKEFERRWLRILGIIEAKDYDKLEAEFAKGKKLRDKWIEYKNKEQNCEW